MERIDAKKDRYRQIIKAVLTELADGPNLQRQVEDHTIFDTQQDRYVLIANGWNRDERVNFIVAHIEIIGGKVWVQADNTDVAVARELEHAGVAPDDIVLGFRQPEVDEVWEIALDKSPLRFVSPRLAHPEQAAELVKQVSVE